MAAGIGLSKMSAERVCPPDLAAAIEPPAPTGAEQLGPVRADAPSPALNLFGKGWLHSTPGQSASDAGFCNVDKAAQDEDVLVTIMNWVSSGMALSGLLFGAVKGPGTPAPNGDSNKAIRAVRELLRSKLAELRARYFGASGVQRQANNALAMQHNKPPAAYAALPSGSSVEFTYNDSHHVGQILGWSKGGETFLFRKEGGALDLWEISVAKINGSLKKIVP